MSKQITKLRARLEILNYIICFSTYKSYGKNFSIPVNEKCTFIGGLSEIPPVGSLCRLSCAPFSKWYLSWLIEHKKEGGMDKYLLESIEDGTMCWWSNVMVDYYNPEGVMSKWKWNDLQFEFDDRWSRACKRRNAYIVLGELPVFHEDGSVTLGTRIRFNGLGDNWKPPSKTFPDYRKVKFKDMLAYYDEAYKEHEERVIERRNTAEKQK